MDFRRMDCTKVRNFLDAHRAKWMMDNLSEEDVVTLYNKVKECSPQAAAGIYRVMVFVKDSINGRR